MQGIPKAGVEQIMGQFKSTGTNVNGWQVFTKTGIYGTDYLNRALVTAIGLGANRPQDAVYPTSETDADGSPTAAPTSTSCTFPRARPRPSMASGR